jgi:hypothetical protein
VVKGLVKSDAAQGSSLNHNLINHADASTTTSEPSPDPSANTASDDVAVERVSDLGISVAISPLVLKASTNASPNSAVISVTYTNGGPSQAENVALSLAADTSHLQVTSPFPAIGTLVPGASATVTATVQALDSLRGGPIPNVTNQVSISSDSRDPSTSDNSRTTTALTINTRPDPPVNVGALAGSFNAGVTWQPPSVTGGLPITKYKITTTRIAGTGTVPQPVEVKVNADGSPNEPGLNRTIATDGTQTYQFLIGGLSNVTSQNPSVAYTFTVQALNDVDYSDLSNSSAAVSPSINNSAVVFTTTTTIPTQQTGSAPTTNDPQVESQTFGTGTTGLGTIQECTSTANPNPCSNLGATASPAFAGPSMATATSVNAGTFCGGVACIGVPAVTKLSNPASGGRYTIILQYGKSIITGTGTSFKVYFMDPLTQSSPSNLPLSKCPTKGLKVTDAPCVAKIVSQPAANPALTVQLSVPPTIWDPVSGTRK